MHNFIGNAEESKHPPIHVAEFLHYVNVFKANDNREFNNEYSVSIYWTFKTIPIYIYRFLLPSFSLQTHLISIGFKLSAVFLQSLSESDKKILDFSTQEPSKLQRGPSGQPVTNRFRLKVLIHEIEEWAPHEAIELCVDSVYTLQQIVPIPSIIILVKKQFGLKFQYYPSEEENMRKCKQKLLNRKQKGMLKTQTIIDFTNILLPCMLQIGVLKVAWLATIPLPSILFFLHAACGTSLFSSFCVHCRLNPKKFLCVNIDYLSYRIYQKTWPLLGKFLKSHSIKTKTDMEILSRVLRNCYPYISWNVLPIVTVLSWIITVIFQIITIIIISSCISNIIVHFN